MLHNILRAERRFGLGRSGAVRRMWPGPGRHILAMVALGFWQMASPAAAATEMPGQFLGQAATVEAEGIVGPLSIGLSNSASESCPCAGTRGQTKVNKVSGISVGPDGELIASGIARSTAFADKTASTATTTQTSRLARVALFGGLITADAIRASANVSVTASALTPSSSGSNFVKLVIAGKPIKSDVPQNTQIALSGIGTVTVNFVNALTYGNQSAGIEVEMLRIDVAAGNSLGLPGGVVIVVGEAYAGYDRTQPAAAIGGYATTLAVTAQAGAALQEAAAGGASNGIATCEGTGGQTLTDSVANLSVAGLLSIDSAATSAFGGPSGSNTVAQTTSTVATVSLLGGLITANNIEAAASETWNGHQSIASTAGTTFGELVVAGVPVATNVPANTSIGLSGIGYVVVNEQPPAAKGLVQVNGLHIVVNLSNSLGLPVGTEIFVSHAEANATKFK